jgi:medium-chain acyl-[acyl-carrier-protein] hydrolase
MPIHQETYNIRSYEADLQNNVHLMSLANYLQDTADRHASALEVSVSQLLERGLSWVLHRMQLNMSRLPSYLENITVKTYPSGIERIYLYRDFYIHDEAGLCIGQATSTWLVIDIEKRQLTSVPADVIAKFEPFRALPKLPPAKQKLSLLDADQAESQQVLVRKNEFDHNNHVNNSAYFQWLLEPLTDDFLLVHTLVSVDIVFKNECQRGDVVQSLVQDMGHKKTLHRLENQSGVVLVEAAIEWKV